MKFAKIFERGDQQILVHLDNNDEKDGNPCIKIMFQLDDWTFASIIPTFDGQDVDENYRRAQKAFEELTDEKAFDMVEKLREDLLRQTEPMPVSWPCNDCKKHPCDEDTFGQCGKHPKGGAA